MKDLIVKSFMRRSEGRNNGDDEDQGAYMEGGRVNY